MSAAIGAKDDDDASNGGTGDLQDLAGEYVLGTLPGPERRDVERRLPNDAALRAAVEAWEARLLPLTALAPPLEPPAALWQGIERGIERAPASAPRRTAPPVARAGWWNNLALWRGLAAGGLACALLLAVRPDLAPVGSATPQYVVVLVAPGGQAPGWVVQVSSPRDLSLTPLARDASTSAPPQDKALQFWTKADDWAGPVSLGLVRPGEPLRVRLDHLPALQPNQLFEITLEPPAGSPTGRPTGPILYIGRAVRLNS
jgi:anti-sigma-K factor RskA